MTDLTATPSAGSAGPAAGDRDLFVETAARLGARICRDALWGGGVCNWIGFAMESLGGRWRHVHRAYGGDLYSGTSGIALFLARLHTVTGERVFKRTALGAIRHALEHGAAEIEPPARIGAYSGCAGIADAALQIASLLAEDALRAPALALLETTAAGELDRHLDVLAGCAGAIPLLLRVRAAHGGSPGAAALADAAVRLGDHLVATARRDEAGWSWGEFGMPGVKQKGNLLGFSHGAGGIGWALLELHHASGEARFGEAAEGAFRYEAHWFDAAHGNWPDLRDPEMSGMPASDEPAFMTAWCHGAAGIGLSRLRAWELSGSAERRQEAEIAVATTLENLRGGTEMSQTNDSLCHGRAGNCETLIYGAQVLGRPEWLRRAAEIGRQEIEAWAAQHHPWPCGTYGSVEVPGLMLGLAGIGYFYLRLAAPTGTPSVLITLP